MEKSCPACGLINPPHAQRCDCGYDFVAQAAAAAAVTCPLCGSAAEQGCVYGSDKGWSLRWYAGPPGFWANLTTGLGGGQPVGGWRFGSGPHAPGLRCERCRRIILSY